LSKYCLQVELELGSEKIILAFDHFVTFDYERKSVKEEA